MTIILSESCSSCSVTYVQRVTKVLRVLNLPGRRLNPIVASIPAITRPYIQAVWAHGCSLLTADRVFGRGVNLFEVEYDSVCLTCTQRRTISAWGSYDARSYFRESFGRGCIGAGGVISVLFQSKSGTVMLSWSLTWWISLKMIGIVILNPIPDN
jgi:hypothetical protein